ncbi:MAG: sigma-70 family RNA polymerase sigma factor [Acidobacteriia bacterium]|nr:sigma-70 family RNA polymerase sigma factor [Terriglobia bacterium]
MAETPLTRAGAVDFEALVHAHARFVFKVAYAVLRNAEDAEDVVQETFFRAYRSGEAGKVERMHPWLARIAWRLAVDRVRRKSGNRRKEQSTDLLQALPTRGPGAEERLLHGERLALLVRLLPALSRNLRETLQLSTVEGMTSAEVAEVLGIPESSVRNRLSRARKLLKEKLVALTEGSYGS